MTSGRIKGAGNEEPPDDRCGRACDRRNGAQLAVGRGLRHGRRDNIGDAVTLTGAVSTLATLAVFQALGNAFLVGLVAWLVISPEHVANLRRRLANIRERWGV